MAINNDAVGARGRLATLSHLTALKKLCTKPEMWEDMLEVENGDGPVESEQLLCHRLPPNIEILSFQRRSGSFWRCVIPDVRQIENIISKHDGLRPSLKIVLIQYEKPEDGNRLNQSFRRYRHNGPGLQIRLYDQTCFAEPATIFVHEEAYKEPRETLFYTT